MRISRLLIGVALIGSTLALGLPAASADLTADLQGYWQFNGNGNDSSGNNLDLTLFGGLGFGSGLSGQALNFPNDESMFAQRAVDDAVFDFGLSDFTRRKSATTIISSLLTVGALSTHQFNLSQQAAGTRWSPSEMGASPRFSSTAP